MRVEGVLDLRGFFAVDERVRPGFQNVRGTVRLSSSASDAGLARLKATVDAHCPVLNVLQSGVPVSLEDDSRRRQETTRTAPGEDQLVHDEESAARNGRGLAGCVRGLSTECGSPLRLIHKSIDVVGDRHEEAWKRGRTLVREPSERMSKSEPHNANEQPPARDDLEKEIIAADDTGMVSNEADITNAEILRAIGIPNDSDRTAPS